MNLHKNSTSPARLERKKSSWEDKMSRFDRECSFWAMKHSRILLVFLTLLLAVLFVILCLILIPPMESGLYYNHLLGGNLL